MSQDIDVRISKVEEIRKKLAAEEESVAKDIVNTLKELINSNPLLEGVRWSQYTPSFNDGDVCEFGVHGPEMKFNLGTPSSLKDDDVDYSNEGWFDEWTTRRDNFFNKYVDLFNEAQVNELKQTVKNVRGTFEKLTRFEDALNEMFGDGYQITVTRDGIESEEYDHD